MNDERDPCRNPRSHSAESLCPWCVNGILMSQNDYILRIGALRRILEDLVDRCDRTPMADGSCIDTLAAHVALGHLHCDVCGTRLRGGNCVNGACTRYDGEPA